MFAKHENFINRELSWLKFNSRVLGEANDQQKPLLERLRFLAITSSNLDEFFMIRLAGLKHQLESGVNKIDAAGLTVEQQIMQISEAAHAMVKEQYRHLRSILRNLEQDEIYFCDVQEIKGKDKEWLDNYFHHTVYPVITPMAVDASHPFPFLANRTLNLAVTLRRDNEISMAVIPVPGGLPRIVAIPGNAKKKRFVFLEQIIMTFAQKLFYGYKIQDMAAFRITRNADLSIDEEDVKDLLAEVEKSLRQRKRGQAVRLEIAKSTKPDIKEFLIQALKIVEPDVYEISGPIDLTCMMKFVDLPGCDQLRYIPLVPQMPADLVGEEDLFAVIRQRDILLHHPFESFRPVIDFVRQAATDPKVLAIKQTLYRVSGNSPIVRALAQAAENGKQVTVLVELKARFDEENNILWAKRLEEAGCHVIYGLVGLKTHAKMILVVRQEESGIKRYVHMGTGNYNDTTAKIYTDMGIFTANDQFGADASGFFNVLSGYSDPPVWNKIVVAPLGLREKIESLIDREITFAQEGRPARIIVKMNALLDKEIIMKLYEASHCGVKIDLIIRGICALRPGIPGVSENITVRSIVGRFLEHSRIFYFSNGGDEKIFLSSADWMPRNLNERVELFFPVDDERHTERIKGILELLLKDNRKAYVMKRDGGYRRVDRRGKGINSQSWLMELASQAANVPEISLAQRLKPMYRKDL
ncbi:Polyphosphate kinase [Propionispora sp. 2/2-37]|uniref:RNA degradosome polyphosphate kinase n=1 Tax=Propionispora sp. 2/2-37 TaxID=1677858 RepID=UPI0006BB5EFF|nr:RNA degradosome polyphosphate kinase [Propionispora sp. 2/2-37]CUH95407.1 Polyphosphate kinase [Propionispora sp. 2/2-37]